jgi:hypothetical protein
MIAIINTGEIDGNGRARYRLQINRKLIAEFSHYRIDGLPACLRLAADAADRALFEQVDAVLKRAEGKDNGL